MDKKKRKPEKWDSPKVPLSRIRRMVAKLENCDDKTEITLEFVLVALFPKVWDNMMDYAKNCYTDGYIQARREFQDESKGS